MAMAGELELLNHDIARKRLSWLGYVTLVNGPQDEDSHPGKGDGLGFVEMPVGYCHRCHSLIRWEHRYRLKHWRRCRK